jgi:hypothetical protein
VTRTAPWGEATICVDERKRFAGPLLSSYADRIKRGGFNFVSVVTDGPVDVNAWDNPSFHGEFKPMATLLVQLSSTEPTAAADLSSKDFADWLCKKTSQKLSQVKSEDAERGLLAIIPDSTHLKGDAGLKLLGDTANKLFSKHDRVALIAFANRGWFVPTHHGAYFALGAPIAPGSGNTLRLAINRVRAQLNSAPSPLAEFLSQTSPLEAK